MTDGRTGSRGLTRLNGNNSKSSVKANISAGNTDWMEANESYLGAELLFAPQRLHGSFQRVQFQLELAQLLTHLLLGVRQHRRAPLDLEKHLLDPKKRKEKSNWIPISVIKWPGTTWRHSKTRTWWRTAPGIRWRPRIVRPDGGRFRLNRLWIAGWDPARQTAAAGWVPGGSCASPALRAPAPVSWCTPRAASGRSD